VFNNIKITLHYSVYMRTSGEKLRIPDEAERVQSVLYSQIRSLFRVICSGVFKGRQARHLPQAPSRYFGRKYTSFFMKNLLSAHIIFSEPHHNSVGLLCIQPFQSRVHHFSCRALHSYNSPGD